MKKLINFKTLTAVLLCCWILGCKKQDTSHFNATTDPVAFYSREFLTDKNFADFFKATVVNSFKLNGLATKSRTGDSLSDTTAAYDYVAETVTAEVLLKTQHPGFFDLTLQQQQSIMDSVCSMLAVEAYRQANATQPLVIYATALYSAATTNGPIMIRSSSGFDITWTEFMACTGTALGSALAEYGGVVREVYNLFKAGTQSLTWGSIFSIAKKVVRNAVPWYKVANVAIGYAACLWAAA